MEEANLKPQWKSPTGIIMTLFKKSQLIIALVHWHIRCRSCIQSTYLYHRDQSVFLKVWHMEVNILWAWLCLIGSTGSVCVCTGVCVCVYGREMCRKNIHNDICVIINSAVNLAAQPLLLQWTVVVNSGDHWQGKCVCEWERGGRGVSRGWLQNHFPRLCCALLGEEFYFKDNLSTAEHFGKERPCGEESLSCCVSVCVRTPLCTCKC